MPTGARSDRDSAPSPFDEPSAASGPLPSELLLRSDGSVDPLCGGPADLAHDAPSILAAVATRPPRRLLTRAFTRQVETVRRHLAPIDDVGVLARSFSSEAFHVRPRADDATGEISAVRLAYAIRCAELQVGRNLPTWPDLTWPPEPVPARDEAGVRPGDRRHERYGSLLPTRQRRLPAR
jgi:hypothetical protein